MSFLLVIHVFVHVYVVVGVELNVHLRRDSQFTRSPEYEPSTAGDGKVVQMLYRIYCAGTGEALDGPECVENLWGPYSVYETMTHMYSYRVYELVGINLKLVRYFLVPSFRMFKVTTPTFVKRQWSEPEGESAGTLEIINV